MSREERILTVGELTGRIRSVLETDFQSVTVQGEISSFKLHASSGHRYVTLKDAEASISCTLWRSRRLFFTPQDGMNVVAQGRITVYPPRGTYQLDVTELRPLGEGELQIAFEKLKRRLAEEGLFEKARKRPLPQFPERIGIVTSPSGAALHDIVSTARRRNPAVQLVLRGASVQGPGAAAEIAEAIADMNAWGKVDVMIVGRGGGSIEDLWAFNEEVVARAIAASKIPIVSAVGHEVDVTIADYVADARAATPTAAAEMLVPVRAELIGGLRDMCYFLRRATQSRIALERSRVTASVGRRAMGTAERLVRQHMQTVDHLASAVGRDTRRLIERHRERTQFAADRLASLHPARALDRGFSIVRRGGAVVCATDLAPGDSVTIEWRDGTRGADITR